MNTASLTPNIQIFGKYVYRDNIIKENSTMALPTIVTRTSKGSALTFGEADANFTNLQSAVITVGDGSSTTGIALNGQLTFSAGTGISVAESGGTITIANTVSDTDTTNFDIGNGTTSFNVSDSETVNIAAGTNISVAVNTGTNTLTIANTQAAGITQLADDTSPDLAADLTAGGFKITNAELKDYKESVHDLGTTDSPTITVSNGNVQKVTISSGLAIPAFSDYATGQSVTLIVSGSGAATGTGSHKFAGGAKTLTTDSVVSIFYDGTTYWTSIATDFQA